MQPKLEALNIPFFMVKGDPIKNIPELCKKLGAACLVTDFASLRLGREWRDEVIHLLPAVPHFSGADGIDWAFIPHLQPHVLLLSRF